MNNQLRISKIVMIVIGVLIILVSGAGIIMLAKSVDAFKKKSGNAENVKATYAIHFDPNGGQGKMEDQIADLGSAVILRTNSFSRVECSFAGWNTKADGSGVDYANSANVKDIAMAGGQTTLYAQWKTQTYTVHFDANGGMGKMDDQILDRGEQQKLAANGFARDDYGFTGWNTNKDGTGIAFDNNADVKDICAAGKTLTLFAQWKVKSYSIHFYSNGGTGSMPDQIADRGTTVKLAGNGFTREHYEFTGWNTKADGTGTSYKDQDLVKDLASAGAQATLYAQWKNRTYTIRYNGNGGIGNMADQVVARGVEVSLSANVFTREHSDFIEWNTKSDGTGTSYSDKDEVTDLAEPNGTVMLYAQWKAQTYTIRYDANGGSGSMADQIVSQGTSVNVAANQFSRDNYDFAGWNTDADGSGTSYAAGESVKDLEVSGKTVTLYAQWKIQTYTIRYEANGGMGVMPDQIADRGVTVKLTPNEFTRENYKFRGWNTMPDGSGENYSSEDEIMDLADSGRTVTLYAQWIIQLKEK